MIPLPGCAAQPATELPPPEASASPVTGEGGAAALDRKPPSIRASSRSIGAFLTQVKDATAKVLPLCLRAVGEKAVIGGAIPWLDFIL